VKKQAHAFKCIDFYILREKTVKTFMKLRREKGRRNQNMCNCCTKPRQTLRTAI